MYLHESCATKDAHVNAENRTVGPQRGVASYH
jgi:hypothetical protein